MIIQEFFDPQTFTMSYVVHAPGSLQAIVIDPVLDFDAASGAVRQTSVNLLLDYLNKKSLSPCLILETHAHADHLSGSQVLKKYFPQAQVAISERITEVQKIFFKLFHLDAPSDGSQFDVLFKDGEEQVVAGLKLKVIPTPGHTPACSAYLIEEALFTGDALFMPDYGVGRCDFPGGSARALFQSVTQNIYSLPPSTRLFVGHDYQPQGRQLKFQTTVEEQKQSNIQLNAQTLEADFVKKREERDQTLSAPRLLLPSIQVNILAGHLPQPEANGTSYLKLPLTIKA